MRFCFVAGLLAVAAGAAAENTAGDVPPGARVSSVVRPDARSGRLIRSSVAIPSKKVKGQSVWAEAAKSVDQYVREKAQEYEVDPLLVHSVIQAESNYNPVAVSRKGAQGLMQLMPGTARRFEVRNTFDPQQNIDGGVRYLKYLLDLFGNQTSPEKLAIAAYNAGEGAVLKYGGVPPYQETTQYVHKVVDRLESKRNTAAKQQTPAQPRVVEFVDARGVVHIQTRYEP